MNELWFVHVEKEVAAKRLIPRHVRAGIARDEVEACERVWGSDLVNGDQILRERLGEDMITEIIVSREDDEWKGD